MFRKKRKEKAVLSGVEVLLRLAQIELMGIEFYEAMEKGAQSEEVRKLAESLKKAEERHHDRFSQYAQRLAAQDHSATPKPIPPAIQEILNTPIFSEKKRIAQSAKYLDDIETLKYAIDAEDRTALILTQLQPHVPAAHRPYIARVIKEEWRHKERLESLLRQRVS